ncbi:MAG: NfeD family protein [Desulfobacterales bacterium]
MKIDFRSVLVAAVFLTIGFSAPSSASVYHVMTVADAIGPAVSDYVQAGIRQAEEEDSLCLILRLDTPGGLADAMRDIVMAMLASRVPIVVYVSPPGARAASAGVMITVAADVAAMAPGTNIGAAHPVGAGGGEISETMSQKVVNDMVAHARSVAERRGRNADWVEKAIRESVSVTETQALELKVIEIVADSMEDLISQLEGREIVGHGKLELAEAEPIAIEESVRTRILRIISNPNVAYILMMIGLAGLYFELSNPGAIFPGVIGGIALILAFFAFQTLPVNVVGILLILLAIVLFVLEIKVTSYGLLSIAGVVCLALGSLMLFESPDPALRISMNVIIVTVFVVSSFFLGVIWLVLKSHMVRARTGESGLIGAVGVVKRALEPEGKVMVHGELWKARSELPLAEGTRVRIASVEGLTLNVEPEERP